MPDEEQREPRLIAPTPQPETEADSETTEMVWLGPDNNLSFLESLCL